MYGELFKAEIDEYNKGNRVDTPSAYIHSLLLYPVQTAVYYDEVSIRQTEATGKCCKSSCDNVTKTGKRLGIFHLPAEKGTLTAGNETLIAESL